MNAVQVPELAVSAVSKEKQLLLQRVLEGLTPAGLYWVAAVAAARAAGPATEAAEAPAAAERLTIVYGSQTGNARRLAEQLKSQVESAGLPTRLLRADAYPTRELAAERHLAIVISTQGEGEPPDDSRGLVEFLAGKRAPKLPQLKFAVLGLGDSSYPQFCAIGRQLDERLAALGGSRFAPVGEADVDIETVAKPWLADVSEAAREALQNSHPPLARVTPLRSVPAVQAFSREQPFSAPVLANERIVSRHSEREVRHLELSLEGSSLHYEPGDALGVWSLNPPALVDQWLAALRLDGAQEVSHGSRTLPLRQWLTQELEITRLGRPLVTALAAIGKHAELQALLSAERKTDFAELLSTHQPIDLLRRYPTPWSAGELLAALRPLTPRLYSIASSSRVVGDEVHLTVANLSYQAHGSEHWGSASSHLAAAGEEAGVRVFIEPNERFRLPADPSRDVIMIGPGTGVAPFRAFVQERRETGAGGRNWLFFGNRHFADDFLYQTEWQAALTDGSLHRLDLAFSRDQADKRYVQHALREQGRELHAWLRDGAYLYVCGDAAQMARDVHATLVAIVAEHGALSAEQAQTWLAELIQQGRYARDVY